MWPHQHNYLCLYYFIVSAECFWPWIIILKIFRPSIGKFCTIGYQRNFLTYTGLYSILLWKQYPCSATYWCKLCAYMNESISVKVGYCVQKLDWTKDFPIYLQLNMQTGGIVAAWLAVTVQNEVKFNFHLNWLTSGWCNFSTYLLFQKLAHDSCNLCPNASSKVPEKGCLEVLSTTSQRKCWYSLSQPIHFQLFTEGNK